MYFAQLDAFGVCFAVTQPTRPLVGVGFVQIPAFDSSYLGRTYSGGVWL